MDDKRKTLHQRGGKKTGDMLFSHIAVVSRIQQDRETERTDNIFLKKQEEGLGIRREKRVACVKLLIKCSQLSPCTTVRHENETRPGKEQFASLLSFTRGSIFSRFRIFLNKQ